MALLKKKPTIQKLVKDIRALEVRREKIQVKLDTEQARQAEAAAQGAEPDLKKSNDLQNEIASINGMIGQVTRQIEDALIAQRQAETESLPGLEQQFNTAYSAHLEKCGRLVGEAISALQTIRQPGTQRLAADLLDVYRSTTKHSAVKMEHFSRGFVGAMNEPATPATIDAADLKSKIKRIKSRNPLQGADLQRWSQRHAQRILAGKVEVSTC